MALLSQARPRAKIRLHDIYIGRQQRMVRSFYEFDKHRDSGLEIEQISPACVAVFYIPSEEKLAFSSLNSDDAASHRVKLLEIDRENWQLTMFPINTLAGHRDFLEPKYDQIRRITLMGKRAVFSTTLEDLESSASEPFLAPTFGPTQPLDDRNVDLDRLQSAALTPEQVVAMLEEIPATLTKDYEYGLGFAKPYRFIIDAVEDLTDCSEIMIIEGQETHVDDNGGVFYLSASDLETARKSLNRITDASLKAAGSVKRATIHNLFARRVQKPEISVALGRSQLRAQFTKLAQGEEEISDEDQESILKALATNAKTISQRNPEKLTRLRSDIDLVTLDSLIQRFDEMLKKKHAEIDWQTFLSHNPFILGLAFGYPIVQVRDQASVGGRKFSGSGEKVADFLVKNGMTNNIAIIEIKTPQTELLRTNTYRVGVYIPSINFSASINQVLDQKYQLERQISNVKENSRIYDVETYSVHCCLIIGLVPEGEDQQKSFEMFRRNSKNVEIVTFDELLTKLVQLRDFLESDRGDSELEASELF